MRKRVKYTIFITLFLSAVSLFSISPEDKADSPVQAPAEKTKKEPNKYDVKKTQINTIEDLEKKSPIDLRDPSNITSEIEYDSENNIYLFKTKIGDDVIVTPFSMSADEYMNYTLKESMARYFRSKDVQETEKKDKEDGDFSFKDIKIGLGPAEKIFGPGGVRVKTQGYTEISMGMKHSINKNPTISENNRSRFMFDFDQKIQLNINASVGDKVNFGMNYDTESTFDFDSKKLKLAYEGKEDEIVKHLEAGNVSMSTTNSLINGGTALFGIKAGLQFGKLKVDAVISQQESESKTVNSKGGTQTTPFEITADQYDENRHFFLSYYFRDNYDKALAKLPAVNSPITIKQIEVWITNKQNKPDNARNIVAFADLAETNSIKNKLWTANPNNPYPNNRANNLYADMTDPDKYLGARDFGIVTSVLNKVTDGTYTLQGGLDYEKVESARLLDASEYTFNEKLGYISLKSTLPDDAVLAVAFKYMVRDTEYKVGEFASEISDKAEAGSQTGALYLKLLKPTSLSPRSHSWDLMMKNIYSLQGAYQVQSDRFRLNIAYQNDTTGTYINYIQAGNIKDSLLLKVMNLDRLDSRNNVRPGGDGIFDFIEGYTILAQTGRVIFPVIEPFGDHLRTRIGNSRKGNGDYIYDDYIYQELYDSTKTVAKQMAEKNKFRISGEYRASSRNEISLGATNVARGSVKVMAGGTVLQEGVHYTVDYISGSVTMIDDSYASSSISVSLENQSFFSMQRKTMLGLNLSYDFTKDFTLGGTIMHMYEKPMTVKTGFGNESLQNTLWGLNTSYRTQSQWLTNMIDKLPFVNATQPSQINFNAEFAHMIPGHYENEYGGGYSYLDDFESTKSKISLKEPYGWRLASTPRMFPESETSDNVSYGYNRALLAWNTIDILFTRKTSSWTPEHIKNDRDQLSNHYVREVSMGEIYPNKQTLYNESSVLSTLNLSFYPTERGPYNLDRDLTRDGYLNNPKKRWGGITQKITNRDFEANNIEYIEFWMMDPFIYDNDSKIDGELYINLGEISEDILKDGKKFYENGLPLIDDTTAYYTTHWGKVPRHQSTTYAFNSDLSDANLRRIDVGLNGLSTQEELEFGAYKEYLAAISSEVSNEAYTRFKNDPAGDNYHYYRGSDYDRDEVSILNRYKYYNNTEGNSSKSTSEKDVTIARSVADVEDLDQDYTMNETEAYFQYKVALNPEKMKVGENHIVDSRLVKVKLRNDTEEEIKWYQFRIPVKEYDGKPIGHIQDFKSIRFIRMFMTGLEREMHLRFATLDLIRAEWRPYTHSLNTNSASGLGSLNVSAINIEENGDRTPINYILPPDVTRVQEPNQPQMRQENEQSLLMQVIDLDPKDSRAVYKSANYDLRRYKRLQMYTHLEDIIGKPSLNRDDLSIFIRLGSDYKSNYYEYEIPLTVTPPPPSGRYSDTYSDRLIVWPKSNMFDFSLELLKNIKLNRNKEKRRGTPNISFTNEYSEYDPENLNNKVTVMGNPSLSEVKVLMIGVRNKNGSTPKSGEVWVNELRLTDFDEEGGWAAQASLNIALSDLGNVSLSGRKETAGFGALDQSLMERRSDDFTSYNIATNIDLGRFVPEQAKLSVPFYYSYSKEVTSPDYDPFDQDVKLEESLATVDTKQEKDSIRSLAQERVITKSINFSNVKVNIQSKTPMPYDPANFSFGYSFAETKTSNPTTVYDATQNYRANLNYSYSPIMKSWTPFKNTKSNAPLAKFAKTWAFNYLPSNIAFQSQMNRLYTETMIRDLESYSLGGGVSPQNNNFLSWSQDFYWDRDFSMNWDFTKNLKTSFSSGTKAEIEEPPLQVNKKLNRDHYEQWKDSVTRSILSLGRPLEYRQNAKITYTLPFNEISFLNWITSTGTYDANYTWNRGAESEAGYEIGNTINNSLTLGVNSRFNMQTLYNKSTFLKEVNQKFDSSRSNRNQNNNARKTAAKKKRIEKDITLSLDSAVVMAHNLKTKNILVTAKHDGKTYPIKFKRIDDNQIRIETKDSATIKLSVIEGPDKTETSWYKVAQYAARGLMSLRSLTVNVNRHNSTYLPGFLPSIGDVFGQASTQNGSSPGVGFAFGLDGGEDFINKALANNWLLQSDSVNISPAVYNSTLKVDIKADLEPIKGLKIALNSIHEKTDRTDFQFMYDNAQNTFGGSFSMTTVALATAFQSSNANNNYQSDAFDEFIRNRDIIARRLVRKYEDIGEQNVAVNKNSPDVLIPAFLAAYTGKEASNVSLSFFPSLLSAVPNWNVTYDGLINIPLIKKKFKTLKLSHVYTAQYRVASFESFASWEKIGDNMGYIQDPVNQGKIASSPYNISSISLTEAFNPLFGAEGTLNNSMTIRLRFNKSRILNLNMAAYQIVETGKNELVVGLGYTIANFNQVLGIAAKSTKGVSNDLKIDVNVGYANNNTLIRRIEEHFTQATGGTKTFSIKASADYTLSKSLILKAYFDRIMNTPLISSSSYPTTNTDFGVSLRFTLSQ